MKIVSLLPSATEIVFALGLGDQLAGVSFECDFPAAARAIPVVSGTVLPTDGSLTASQIDAAVAANVAAGESIYTLDDARIRDRSRPHPRSGPVSSLRRAVRCCRGGARSHRLPSRGPVARSGKSGRGDRLHRLGRNGDGNGRPSANSHGSSCVLGWPRYARAFEGYHVPGSWRSNGRIHPSTPATGFRT